MSRLTRLEEYGLVHPFNTNMLVHQIVNRLRTDAIAKSQARPFQSFEWVNEQIKQTIRQLNQWSEYVSL